jgi:hypothetical protein
MSKAEFEIRHQSEADHLFSVIEGIKYRKDSKKMKYALLNHLPLEQFEARKDPALISAWKSYVEAIQASGVLMESVELPPPDKAWEMGWLAATIKNRGRDR